MSYDCDFLPCFYGSSIFQEKQDGLCIRELHLSTYEVQGSVVGVVNGVNVRVSLNNVQESVIVSRLCSSMKDVIAIMTLQCTIGSMKKELWYSF